MMVIINRFLFWDHVAQNHPPFLLGHYDGNEATLPCQSMREETNMYIMLSNHSYELPFKDICAFDL